MEIRKLAFDMSISGLDWARSGKKNKGTKNPSKLKKPLMPTRTNVGVTKSFTLIKVLIVVHTDFFSSFVLS